MGPGTIVLVLIVLGAIGYYLGRSKAQAWATAREAHSVTGYHGTHTAMWAVLPGLLLALIWGVLAPRAIDSIVLSGIPAAERPETSQDIGVMMAEIKNIASGAFGQRDDFMGQAAASFNSMSEASGWIVLVFVVALGALGIFYSLSRLAPVFRARHSVERVAMVFLMLCATIAILTTLGIVLSLLFESLRFFGKVSVSEFLFGMQWSPQTAIRADQVGSSGSFGAVPLFTGTILISVIALLVAVPLGLMSAIYLSDYASLRVRSVVKPLLEVLAGIPTVVYGFFAILTVAPVIRDLGASLGMSVSSNSALAAGLVMGIMIVPFVSSLSDDVINAVPQSLRDGSAAMGATRSETIRQVILPAALPGIVGAVLLAASRAIGETMIVVMAAGLAANLTANPFAAVTTVTVQIATLLVGDQEFDSPKTLSVFALGLVLFIVTLCLNVIALRIVQKYREKYD